MKSLFLFLLAIAAASQAADRPNIVFILLDNVGREWFGCYGSEEGCTPAIDSLAASGVRFANCYTTVVCGPSRVQLLTGRYPHRTGWHVHHDAALYGGGGLDPRREITVARVLRDHGYATAITGKWQVNNLYDEPDALSQHGFQQHLVWPGSIDRDRVDGAFRAAFEAAIARNDAQWLSRENRHIESRYWDPVVIRDGKRERLAGEFGPDVFAKFAHEHAASCKDKPFFLYWPMVLVHGQSFQDHTVLTPANRGSPPADERGRFAGMLRYADGQICSFIEHLDRIGLRERTIVFIASDNGTEKSISARTNGRMVQGGLYQLTEAGGNVPLIINCPGIIAGGRAAPLADFTDILPTICGLAGAQMPAGVKLDGQSFSAFLRSEGKAPREWIFNEYGSDRVIRDEQFKLTSKGDLFDLNADPDEKHPVSGHDEERAKLQKILGSMPPVTPLPFEHRSLSAFKLRSL